MVMHKIDRSSEEGLPPSPEMMARMGALMGEMTTSGVLLAGEGLRPSAERVRLRFSGGQRTVMQGPLPGTNELIAGFALIRVKSMEEAIGWASRFADLVGDMEIDVGPITEPWDLGFCPKPEGDVPMRFLLTPKADKNSEAGVPPTPELASKMGKLLQEMKEADILLATERLQPSSQAVRIRFDEGKHTMMDGPFTESKELIAGYAMLNVTSKQEAIDLSLRFAGVVGDVEMDVRPVDEASDIPSGP
ncbi:YciI family protein [Chondromyces crocatus]|nr:YciI family protein [Chondromyces crocatus]